MQMNRLVLHHTGGGLTPSDFDKAHYHRLIGGDGEVHFGLHPISANAPGRQLISGRYAAHVLNLNSGSIGLALAAMADGDWHAPRACAAFPRPQQVEAMVQEAARLCIDHCIPIDRRTVLTHAEVEITLGVNQRAKWDFDYDPWGISDTRDPLKIGDALRAHIRRAVSDLGHEEPVARRGPMPVLRRGHHGDAVKEAQELLNKHGAGIAADRAFGPATFAAVVAFQKSQDLLPDGIVGRMTWAALRGC